MTHLGSYRVRARVYTTSTTNVWVRLLWGVGAAVGVITNPLTLVPPGASNFYIVDLGEIRIDWPPVGLARWEGQIQAMGASGGENIAVDQVYLQPLDDSAGFAIANPSVTVLTSPVAADNFTETSGDLGGKTASVGGAWIEPISGAVIPPVSAVSNATANHAGAGTVAWTLVGAGSGTIASLATATGSQYIQVSNFGFAIPSTATVVGVALEIDRNATGGPVYDMSSSRGGHAGLVLQNAGTALAGAVDRSDTAAWPTSSLPFFYGGPTDLWGTTLTPAIVNSSTFGFFYAAFNPSGGTTATSLAAINFAMTIYYTPAGLGTGNFSVDSANHRVTRTAPDSNNHYAVLGSALVDTDVSADLGVADFTVATATAGVVARYVDTNNYALAYVRAAPPSGATVCQVQVLAVVAGTINTVLTLSPAFPPVLPTTFNLRLVVDTTGLAQIFLNNVLLGSGTHSSLAAGGALATGKPGIAQFNNTAGVLTTWDNFVAYATSNTDAVIFGGASAALRFDGMYRADPSNTYFGPVAQVVGDLPRLPPSGIENRPVELFILTSQGDLQSKPDRALGSFTTQVTYRPVRIHRA